jgi:diguanylate cyclase (GGDEF)-like protein
MSLPSSDPAVTDTSVLLHAQIQRLNGPLSLATVFPAGLEQRFHAWLHERAMSFLRQYLPVLGVAYVLFTSISLVKIYAFTAPAFQAHDARVFWWMVGVLGADTVLFTVCVRRPSWDRWFWLYSGSVDVIMLATVSLGMITLQDPQNVRIATALLVVCFVLVFGTGMLLLRYCMSVAALAFLLTLAGALAMGLTPVFWGFSYQFALVFSGMVLICHFMMRSHRLVFLHEQLLLQEKEQLTGLSEELAELSLRDALTGVANRRRFDEVLGQEWERARREQAPLALLFIDIDFFKGYNDHYGHQAGDDCLRAVAFVMVDTGRRPTDLVARYGGEEFVLLLPNTDSRGALETAERIRVFLAQAAIPHALSPQGRVTASIGVAVRVPAGPDGASALVSEADAALYLAKAGGRDRIELAPRSSSMDTPLAEA